MKQTIEDVNPRGKEIGVGLILIFTFFASLLLVLLKSFGVISMPWVLVISSVVWIPMVLFSVSIAVVIFIFTLIVIIASVFRKKKETESEH